MKWLLAAAVAALAASAQGQVAATAEQGWQALARADAEAALKLIQESHPGAAAELGDSDFLRLLATARTNAERRLPMVKDYYGHAALMAGLANDFRDGHIWSNAIVSPSRRIWSGIIIVRRGGQWVVGAHETVDGEAKLEDARLLSCDGADADRFARERIGTFHAHPGVEADLARNAPRLLLDDQNPFAPRPAACSFKLTTGETVNHRPNWREVSPGKLQEVASRVSQPAQAGLGVSSFSRGQWIELGTLGNEAAQLVETARSKQGLLRSAPMVVVDLRGNGGGNSHYAVELARVVVGDARVEAVQRLTGDCLGAHWRVSPGNLESLREFVARLPEERRAQWQAQADDMAEALRAGRSFSPELPACAHTARPAQAPQAAPMQQAKQRLVLVTDRSCFSSCLMAADLFRRLGALHVGEGTDMSTRYMEVREIVLPSGLRTFSTLRKLALGLGDFGPYEPAISYTGALTDTEALKAWVAGLPG